MENIIISNLVSNRNVLIHGIGGCLDPDTLIYKCTTEGPVLEKIKNIKVDDQILGVGGTKRKVLKLISGTDQMFDIISYYGGIRYRVNSTHILTLQKDGKLIDIPLNEYLKLDKKDRKELEWAKTLSIFDEAVQYINGQFVRTTVDQLQALKLKMFDACNTGFLLSSDSKEAVDDDVVLITDHIPREYLLSVPLVRYKLLSVFFPESKNIFQSEHISLIDDLAFIIGSLGDNYTRIDLNTIRLHDRDIGSRFEVIPAGEGPYSGFELDGDNRFVLSDFTITHNTGKSYTLRTVYSYLLMMNYKVHVCAMTGIAAVNLSTDNMKATTLHSWAGVGLAREKPETLVGKILRNPRALYRWRHTDVLILDEVSMLGSSLFEKLDFIARDLRKNDKPFGGILLLFSGDFLQLPPVKDGWAFKTLEWEKCDFVPIYFSEPKRYPDTGHFEMLSRIRIGKHNPDDIKVLSERVRKYQEYKKDLDEKEKEYKELTTKKPDSKGIQTSSQTQVDIIKKLKSHIFDVKPTILYSKKIDVSSYNETELNKLPGPLYLFEATDTIRSFTIHAKSENYIEKLNEVIPNVLFLKEGAQVILKANIDIDRGLANGSRGVILKLFDNSVMVKFRNGVITEIASRVWEYYDYDGKATRTQLPFILGFASSIHASQGLTLDYAIVDLSTSVFTSGQAYVALSRVRTLDGLFINEFYPSSIKVNQEAMKYNLQLIDTEEKNELNVCFTGLDSVPYFTKETEEDKEKKKDTGFDSDYEEEEEPERIIRNKV